MTQVQLDQLRGEPLHATGWANLSVPRLVGIAAILHGRFIELAILALDDERRPVSEIWGAFLELLRSDRELDRAVMRTIRESKRETELARELEENRRSARLLDRELTIRAAIHNPAMLGMLAVQSKLPPLGEEKPGEPDLATRLTGILETGLEIDRLTDYESWDNNLKQTAIRGALEVFNKRESRSDVRRRATEFEVPPAMATVTPRLNSRRWNRGAIYGNAFEWVVNGLAPVFFDDPWLLPNAAKEAYRAELQEREARKRGGARAHKVSQIDGEPEETARSRLSCENPDQKIVPWDDSLESRMLGPDLLEPERRTAEDRAAEREEYFRVEQEKARYRRLATKKWGAKGRRFVEARLEGKTIQEAAAAARISRQTAHKYLRELKNTEKKL